MALQEPLYTLRQETQAAFDEAKFLEKRWKELEKEQREVYQVCYPLATYYLVPNLLTPPPSALPRSSF